MYIQYTIPIFTYTHIYIYIPMYTNHHGKNLGNSCSLDFPNRNSGWRGHPRWLTCLLCFSKPDRSSSVPSGSTCLGRPSCPPGKNPGFCGELLLYISFDRSRGRGNALRMQSVRSSPDIDGPSSYGQFSAGDVSSPDQYGRRGNRSGTLPEKSWHPTRLTCQNLQYTKS